MTGNRQQVRWVVALAMVCMLAGCGPTEPAKNPQFRTTNPSGKVTREVVLAGPPALPSVVIAELASEESVVHFGRNGTKGLLVARSGGKWAGGPVRVSRSGENAVADDAQLHEIAPAPKGRGPVALGAHGAGFVFAWASPVAAGHEVWAAVLDARGGIVGKPRSAGRTFEKVTWIEVQSSDKQPTRLLWETEEGSRRSVFSAQVPRSDETPGALATPLLLTPAAIGWQAATGPAGTVLAWVDGEPGQVRVLTLDANGRASNPTALTTGNTALADVHVTALADRFIVGWTDTASGDHEVIVAHVGADGAVMKPAEPVLATIGGQVLVNLIASHDHKRVLVAWERDLGVAVHPREIQLSVVSDKGKLVGHRAVLDFHSSNGTPHMVADGPGFAALTLAPLVQRAQAKTAEPVVGPMFVRFGPELDVRTAEPIRVAELKDHAVGMEGVPELVHGLSCELALCSVLATGTGTPALMALVNLPVRTSTWRAPAHQRPEQKPPLVATISTLADVSDPIADVSSVVLADGRTLVAWVTHAIGYDQTADGPSPATAKLAFRFIDKGVPGAVHTLSVRAISAGGVSVLALPAESRDAVAVIGWAGPANGPQVYASLIRADGSKKNQKTVTQIVRGKKHSGVPNEVYDVDIAHDGHDNFVFVWSDSRDGNPEIYAARISPHLQKNIRDTRLTSGAGASIEPQLMVTNDRVLVAFSEADEGGAANVFVAQLDGATLALKGQPQAVETSAAHSRTPRWAGAPGALALSWVDEETAETPSAVRLVAVDDHGVATSAARRVRADSGGSVTSRLVSCDGGVCRGLLGASDGDVLHFAPFSAPRESGAPIAAPVTTVLGGGSKQDLSMVSADGSTDAIFFVHDGASGVRIRSLGMRW